MDRVVISITLPCLALSPNGRVHWGAKQRATRQQRMAAWGLTLQAIGRNDAPRWTAATVKVTYFYKVHGTRDRDNALAKLKAAFDGMADAGLVVNDSAFTYLPVGESEIDRRNPRVQIEVWRT